MAKERAKLSVNNGQLWTPPWLHANRLYQQWHFYTHASCKIRPIHNRGCCLSLVLHSMLGDLQVGTGVLVKTLIKIWIMSDKQSCRRMQCRRLFLMRLMWGSKGKVWKYLSKRVMVTVYSRIFISLSLNWKIHDKYINNHFSFIITYSAKLLLLKLFLAWFHCFSVEWFLVVTIILLLPENPSTAES